MHHEVTLIATIALAFVFAAVLGYGADRLRLPPLVGYLAAGILIGPATPGFVADTALAGQLAELGVILLMFGVGLHFSAADLLAVRGVALPGAIGQIILATLLGIGLCSLWGWGIGAGVVFGLSLSVASTVVLLKALEERNMLNTANGRVAVGWLIVEDLAMVLALVLLPAFAGVLGGNAGTPGHGSSEADALTIALSIGKTLLKVGTFAALALYFGPKIVPRILKMAARTGSRELFTLTVLALALGIAFGAAVVFDVSFALGAFFAGVVMSESRLSHRAAADSLPLQDAFTVLFFVSVGMLFDPSVLLREPLAVIGALALIMVGKSLIAFVIVLALRYPIGIGLTVSASLAQIGEFSFILAGLGISLGLLSREGQDLILAAAILSIILNPLAFMVSDALQKVIRSAWPLLWASYGKQHSDELDRELQRIRELGDERDRLHHLEMQKLIKTFPLFAQVDEHSLDELLLLFKPSAASPGDRVVRKGDRGDGMYFIAAGAVEVKLDSRAIRLEAGSFFGEMALLSGERRIADVVAIDFCEFLVLARRDFNRFVAKHPELRAAVDNMASQRRQTNTALQEEV